ncbi:ATP-binding protein [Bacillus coahuilensis]|uniref:ATP-binding protein n=2 Tax=Bacillus coahuilensis TaxID=408580 RepID=UPI0001850FFC|nr:ATP-binding protein [Bacillus coahuilensis]
MKEARKNALVISLTFIGLGVLWIFISDTAAYSLSKKNYESFLLFQRYKGWVFMVITGLFLYGLVYKRSYGLIQSREALRKKERQLERSKQHYKSLFNHNPDMVFELCRKGLFININPAGEGLLGHSASELKGKSVEMLLEGEALYEARRYYINSLNGYPQKYEIWIQSKGKKILLRISMLPIIVSGEITGVFGIARDITTEKKKEEMMIVSEKMSVIGQLAAAVAHEIRNPLTSLKGFVQLMQTSKEYNSNYLSIMFSEIERINLIAGEMLILGKQQDIRFAKKDSKEILKQVLVLMEAQANLNNIAIECVDETTASTNVLCDSNQLKQVFINVIKNALESIPSNGRIYIRMKSLPHKVIIEIVDNGHGIDQERLDRLGEPFYSTKEKGTGLGLAVSYSIIERHSGSIHITSEVGKGTKVDIILPTV